MTLSATTAPAPFTSPGELPGKENIRAAMRERRLALCPEERRRLSLAAASHLLKNDVWKQARRIALYMAVRGEVETSALAENAWKEGKTLFLPVCASPSVPVGSVADGQTTNTPGSHSRSAPESPDGSQNPLVPSSAAEHGVADACEPRIQLIPCPGPHCLKPGTFGIPEPDPLHEDVAQCSADGLLVPDIIIVPGTAFTAQGQRLGMGGGYYDRLFVNPCYASCIRIGLAYSFQITDSLPQEPWDAPMHALCTEKGLLWTPIR